MSHMRISRKIVFNRQISCNPSRAPKVTKIIGIQIIIAILKRNLIDNTKLIITNFIVTHMFWTLIRTLRFIASKKSNHWRQTSILLYGRRSVTKMETTIHILINMITNPLSNRSSNTNLRTTKRINDILKSQVENHNSSIGKNLYNPFASARNPSFFSV